MDGQAIVNGDRKAIYSRNGAMFDSPLMSGGSPRGTLRVIYDALVDRFIQKGLREQLLEEFRSRCTLDGEAAQPLRYDGMDSPYPADAIRLAVLPIEASAEQQQQIVDACGAVCAALPRGDDFAYYCNEPEHWHVTLFHTSRLEDCRPDPLTAGGGIQHSLGGPTAQPAPDEGMLHREVESYRSQVAMFQPITLQAYRVVLADSGCVLLCCTDLSDQVAQLRGRLRSAFPGAPAQQTSICHVTLARMAGGGAALTPEFRQRVQTVCNDWSSRLRGMTFVVDKVVHVAEEVFSTVQGRRKAVFPLRLDPSASMNGAPNGLT